MMEALNPTFNLLSLLYILTGESLLNTQMRNKFVAIIDQYDFRHQ